MPLQVLTAIMAPPQKVTVSDWYLWNHIFCAIIAFWPGAHFWARIGGANSFQGWPGLGQSLVFLQEKGISVTSEGARVCLPFHRQITSRWSFDGFWFLWSVFFVIVVTFRFFLCFLLVNVNVVCSGYSYQYSIIISSVFPFPSLLIIIINTVVFTSVVDLVVGDIVVVVFDLLIFIIYLVICFCFIFLCSLFSSCCSCSYCDCLRSCLWM